jgi:hypothetical protein
MFINDNNRSITNLAFQMVLINNDQFGVEFVLKWEVSYFKLRFLFLKICTTFIIVIGVLWTLSIKIEISLHWHFYKALSSQRLFLPFLCAQIESQNFLIKRLFLTISNIYFKYWSNIPLAGHKYITSQLFIIINHIMN